MAFCRAGLDLPRLWAGWFDDQRIEELTAEWTVTTAEEARSAAIDELQKHGSSSLTLDIPTSDQIPSCFRDIPADTAGCSHAPPAPRSGRR
jgi:hypothetical protein